MFEPCRECTDPLHCGSWAACCGGNRSGSPLDALDPKPAGPHLVGPPERVGPPYPTQRGGCIAVASNDGSPPKIINADFAGIEQRIMAKMTAINGAADHVVERFIELSKTDAGTPLFKYKFADGSLTPTARLLHNLVVNAIQGEVTL